VTEQIIQFIGNMNVGVLGSLGLALLLYTAISLVQKIEVSFNFIWHVPEPRSFGTRFSSYLSVLLVGPLLVFSALGITAAASSSGIAQGLLAFKPLAWAAVELGKLVPYLLIIGLFTFIYIFIPNTKVRWGPALGGALVGGVAWQTAGWAFASFVAGSSQYTAIYSGFAILILFMIWIYVSWLIVLIGASVSFYLQHGEYVMAKPGEPAMSSRMRERLALLVMQRIARNHLTARPPLSADQLVRELAMPSYAIRQVLELMTATGLLVPSRSVPSTWLPVRDLAMISAWQVIEAVRREGEHESLDPTMLALPPSLERLVAEHDQALAGLLANVSVRELADVPEVAEPGAAATTSDAMMPASEAVVPEPELTPQLEVLPEPEELLPEPDTQERPLGQNSAAAGPS
jgi:membrane protein